MIMQGWKEQKQVVIKNKTVMAPSVQVHSCDSSRLAGGVENFEVSCISSLICR